MTPVILLGHGSPDPRSAAGLRRLAGEVARLRRGLLVEVAFLDHDDPGLTGLAHELTWAGHRRAIVVPAFLTAAFHVRTDVPRVVAEAQEASGMHLVVAEPIGPDPTLVESMDRQLPRHRDVVLACAGTRDTDAQAQLDELARRWAATRGTKVMVAHAAMATPDVTTALASLESSDGEPPVVAFYVLFPGVLHDRIVAAAGGLEMAAPLGADVAALVLRRVDAVS